jgi:hypothetical protein
MGGYRVTDPETSRAAYAQMIADGSVSRRRLEIVAHMSAALKPGTAGEIAHGLEKNRNNVATRLSELEHLDVVEKCYEATCPVSRKVCWTWQLTGRQPSGAVPKGTGKTALYKKERDIANRRVGELVVMSTRVAEWLESAPDIDRPKAAQRIRTRIEKILGD